MSQSTEFGSPLPRQASDSPMFKLIRSKATRLFLTKHGHWTAQVQDAAHFPDDSMAQTAVHKLHLRKVELYYLFDHLTTSEYDFTISLG